MRFSALKLKKKSAIWESRTDYFKAKKNQCFLKTFLTEQLAPEKRTFFFKYLGTG